MQFIVTQLQVISTTAISLSPPAELVCDGDLSEWADIDPIRIFPSEGASVVSNTTIDGDADLSVLAYLAVDNDYFYIAFDVEDDVFAFDPSISHWLNDGTELFIGLYDWRGLKHTSLKRGEEPDYDLKFLQDRLRHEKKDAPIYTVDSTWYYIDAKFPTGYVVETRIPWTEIAFDDDPVFTPVEGMRIPIDFTIQDSDVPGEREGILTWSPDNQDLSYQTPTRWTYTWIGALWEPVAAATGDINGDGSIDVLDVLAVVNHILATSPLTGDALERADCNGDGEVNVLDALGIVNVILGTGECVPGASKVEVTPEVMAFLKSLETYLSGEDFARFMALVKGVMIPAEYHLAQNYPNPFNPETSIEYALPISGKVTLSVYNILGQEVKVLVDGQKEAGYHKVQWDAHGMASGVYFYRIQAGHFIGTKKCLILK